jgi:hypothetical protein
MEGEVSEDDVMFIVTRTNCPDFDRYIKVVEHYYAQGNLYAKHSERYEFGAFQLEEVIDLATHLYNTGKIHQPRVFADNNGNYTHPAGMSIGYTHPVGYGDGLWMEVVPSNQNTTPAVVAAYNHYKMLDSLTNDRH